MKCYAVVNLISAIIIFLLGALICTGRLSGFARTMCKESRRHKVLGGYFIASGVIIFTCSVAAWLEGDYTVAYLVAAFVALMIFITLIRREAV